MFKTSQLLYYIMTIPGLLLAFTFHEYAHAKMADLLGDKTPRYQGRLTLNPVKHLDLMGTILIIFTGFGWAKPVQINKRAFKNFYKDDLKVSLAGPIANLLVAIVCAFIWGISLKFIGTNYNEAAFVLVSTLKIAVTLNVNLFVFNLIPIPGFDGFSILFDIFPKAFSKHLENIYKYQYVILIALIFLAGGLIAIPSRIIVYGILKLVSLILF